MLVARFTGHQHGTNRARAFLHSAGGGGMGFRLRSPLPSVLHPGQGLLVFAVRPGQQTQPPPRPQLCNPWLDSPAPHAPTPAPSRSSLLFGGVHSPSAQLRAVLSGQSKKNPS